MYNTSWAAPTILIASVLLLTGCEFSNSCGDRLLYDEPTNQCVCPPGSEPDADRNGCVLPSGEVIPWAGFDVPYLDDVGPDMSSFDGGLDMPILDAGPDLGLLDVGPDLPAIIDAGDDSSDAGPDAADAGPPPGPAQARFPWNGFTTGSIHVPEDSPVVNHPLRPKLMWEVVDDAEQYQVQMTRECDVSGFRDCAFAVIDLDETTTETTFRPSASLEVARVRPVGSRYFWRVRACSAGGCSAWTEVRYLDVGRDPHDLDGDGYADLAVGAPGQSTPEVQEGNVYVYFGSVIGYAASPELTIDNPQDFSSGSFGQSVASADINGDGFADLIAATYGLNGDGTVGTYVFLGGPAGPPSRPDARLQHVFDLGNSPRQLTNVGDINADGFTDIVVSAPNNNTPAERGGCIYLFFGSTTGLNPRPDRPLCNPRDETGAFGEAVVGNGDVNGDGIVDLLVGAQYQSFPEEAEGNAFFYYGSLRGPGTLPDLSIDNPEDLPHGGFGFAISFGDFNGDGLSDLMVDTHVFYGTAAGPPTTPDSSIRGRTAYSSLVSGDINGDGFDDLVSGGPNAEIYFGGLTGVRLDPSVVLEDPLTQPHGGFTASLGSADGNGDGYADLVVGAPAQDNPETREGQVYVYLGRSAIRVTPATTLDNPTDQPYGGFGASVL